MAYRVEDLVTDTTVTLEPGVSVLISGSSAAAEDRLLDVLAGGAAAGETGIVISTIRGARDIIAALRERDGIDPARIGIIDCTESGGTVDHEVPVEQLSSPGDLTGISLEFAKFVRRFETTGQADHIRVGLSSVSTLLMYTEVQTTFRFLHVFTSRISAASMLGVFSLDPEMHDPQTVNTVRAIFDCEAILTDGEVTLRGSGYSVE